MIARMNGRRGGIYVRFSLFAALACAFTVSCPGGQDGAGPQDPPQGPFQLVEVVNPLNGESPRFELVPANPPVAGASVYDARLGTQQVRVIASEGLRHEYSRHSPFNADKTRVVLLALSDGEWRVYRTASVPYDIPANLARTLSCEEPRWDATDPAVIWGTQDFSILRTNVETGETSTVKDFRQDPVVKPILEAEPDLYRITMKDEGEASLDRRFWAFIVQGSQDDYRARYLLVWDREQDEVLGLRKLAASESLIDWVGMSPKGTWVLIGSDYDNGGNLAGLVMANRALTAFYPLHSSTGHADVGLDANGNEVIVMQNAQTDYIDLVPLETSVRPVPSGDAYAGSGHVPLIRLFYASDSPHGLNSGVHIGCDFPGWCVVSTYIEPGAAEQNWLDRSIVLVRLDPAKPRVYYLAKVYGTRGAYWEETQAAISRDGTRVVWATNWNRKTGQEKVWMMETRLPANWPALLPSNR